MIHTPRESRFGGGAGADVIPSQQSLEPATVQMPPLVSAHTYELAAPEPGWVFWITGLPGAGKTTIGELLFTSLRRDHPNSALLDGNVLRDVFEHDLGYSLEDRRRCARRYAGLAAMLAAQGLHVVVATVSMFEEVWRWNRRHLPRYLEVYVRAPLALRRARDPALYAAIDVPGVDLAVATPAAPDLVVDNDGTTALDTIVATIARRAALRSP